MYQRYREDRQRGQTGQRSPPSRSVGRTVTCNGRPIIQRLSRVSFGTFLNVVTIPIQEDTYWSCTTREFTVTLMYNNSSSRRESIISGTSLMRNLFQQYHLTVSRVNCKSYTQYGLCVAKQHGVGVLCEVKWWWFVALVEYKSSAVAEMGDCLATINGPKIGGCCAPFRQGELSPHVTQCRLPPLSRGG